MILLLMFLLFLVSFIILSFCCVRYSSKFTRNVDDNEQLLFISSKNVKKQNIA